MLSCDFPNRWRGLTLVELLVTIAIVSIVAATLGVSVVRLLTIQEREREEAYVRERLSDMCGAYADYISIGTTFGENDDITNRVVRVKYRLETGGVSLETGTVTRAAFLSTMLNATNGTAAMHVDAFEDRELMRKVTRHMRGDAALIPLAGEIISCTITPLNFTNTWTEAWEGDNVKAYSSALGYLQMAAKYCIEDEYGETVTKTATVGRVVRLWNRE